MYQLLYWLRPGQTKSEAKPSHTHTPLDTLTIIVIIHLTNCSSRVSYFGSLKVGRTMHAFFVRYRFLCFRILLSSLYSICRALVLPLPSYLCWLGKLEVTFDGLFSFSFSASSIDGAHSTSYHKNSVYECVLCCVVLCMVVNPFSKPWNDDFVYIFYLESLSRQPRQ